MELAVTKWDGYNGSAVWKVTSSLLILTKSLSGILSIFMVFRQIFQTNRSSRHA